MILKQTQQYLDVSKYIASIKEYPYVSEIKQVAIIMPTKDTHGKIESKFQTFKTVAIFAK